MNITYLLGAGASCQSLPMVKNIPEALEKFAQDFLPLNLNEPNAMSFLDKLGGLANKFLNKHKNDKGTFEKYHHLLLEFHRDIVWLQSESKNHSSIDTLAKKLHLQNNKTDLKKLKYILSCFFIYEQTCNFDKRYDSFFASILESLSEIPSNLKILSWNYDSQLEIAFSNFSNTSIEKSRETLNIFSKGNKIDSSKINLNNTFNVFKINGTTNIKDKESKYYDLIESYNINKTKLVSSFLEIYSSSHLFFNSRT
ncbi:hypothetical protein N9W61_02205 [Algibacter sp.]|nr:hypothetical protein [Algibacter sp.]